MAYLMQAKTIEDHKEKNNYRQLIESAAPAEYK